MKIKKKESSTQILEATKSNDSNAEDINFVRLRKMYNSLLKEKNKNKIEENHGNIFSDLQKAKINAVQELRIAIEKQKEAIDEKNTVLKIFDCMKQLFDKKVPDVPKFNDVVDDRSLDDSVSHNKGESSNISESDSLGAIKKYSCNECDYEGINELRLNQHKKDKHLINLTVMNVIMTL